MTSQHSQGFGQHSLAIAEFVSGFRYGDIPSEVLERIKLLVLDSLGCAIFASVLPWSKLLLETLMAVDSSRQFTVLGHGSRLSAPHAALVNGTLIQGFELDDVHRDGVLHVGAVTLPAVFAVAESAPSMSGQHFLAACVAGYEIGPRVGRCMGPEHIAQGWHSGATLGVFSAAAGASAALRLSPQQTVHALGIAGTQSAGLMAAQFGAMVKRMHAGRSSQSGLYGALLAARGFTGITDVFENPYGGFCSTFSRSTDRFDLGALSSGLGQRFETMAIALKFYSCVGSNHTSLDAVRSLRAQRPFDVDELADITIHGSRVTVDHVGWHYEPQGLTSAQLNLPYCVATLLLEGDVFVDQFSESLVADPSRMRLSRQVKVVEDPAITARGARFRHMVRVEIRLKDGTVLRETREFPKGSEHDFASQQQVIDKFMTLVGRRLSTARASRVVDRVLHIERLESVGPLLRDLGSTE